MASTTFFMKRHDTLPSLVVALQDVYDRPLELAVNGTTVKFLLKDIETGVLIASKDCVILDGSAATVQVDWNSSDTVNAGSFLGEFEVTYPNSGGKFTVPTDDSFVIVIIEDYNNT